MDVGRATDSMVASRLLTRRGTAAPVTTDQTYFAVDTAATMTFKP